MLSFAKPNSVVQAILNSCDDTCPSFAEGTAGAVARLTNRSRFVFDTDRLTLDGNYFQGSLVKVSHITYLGVCGFEEDFFDVHGSLDTSKVLYVSRSMMETDDLVSLEEAAQCNQFDMVWVPSVWNKKTLVRSGVDEDRVIVVTEAVETNFYQTDFMGADSCLYDKNATGIQAFASVQASKAPYTFLSIFKWEDRKNWRVLIRGFLSEFKHEAAAGHVRLWIKTSRYMGSEPGDEMRDYVIDALDMKEELASITLVDERLTAEEIRCLYWHADAFVLPTHGEGFGLPLAEALAMGKVTLGPTWGGSQQFLDERISAPLNGTALSEEHSGFKIDFRSFKTSLRAAYNGTFDKRAAGAASFIRAAHSPDVVAKHIVSVVEHGLSQKAVMFSNRTKTVRGGGIRHGKQHGMKFVCLASTAGIIFGLLFIRTCRWLRTAWKPKER